MERHHPSIPLDRRQEVTMEVIVVILQDDEYQDYVGSQPGYPRVGGVFPNTPEGLERALEVARGGDNYRVLLIKGEETLGEWDRKYEKGGFVEPFLFEEYK